MKQENTRQQRRDTRRARRERENKFKRIVSNTQFIRLYILSSKIYVVCRLLSVYFFLWRTFQLIYIVIIINVNSTSCTVYPIQVCARAPEFSEIHLNGHQFFGCTKFRHNLSALFSAPLKGRRQLCQQACIWQTNRMQSFLVKFITFIFLTRFR